jgi:uncharacterized protein (TIGR02266 family)
MVAGFSSLSIEPSNLDQKNRPIMYTAKGKQKELEHPSPGSDALATGEGRRAHRRHHVEIQVTLESESNFYVGLTENLSEGGLFIATVLVKPIGTQIGFSLKLGDAPEPISALGTVRWVREYSETSDTGPGMGVRFDRMAPEHLARVRQFLATRAPLFHEED